MIRRIDLSLDSPAENLALDESLLRDLERRLERLETSPRQETARESVDASDASGWLRFWESSRHFVVLGVSSRIDDDVERGHCEADGVPILRRASGGGTVLQGPGCLNFALAIPFALAPELRDIRSSYERIVVRTGQALGLEGVGLRGSCDLAIDSIKFSGNAQKRGKRALLHHGTILHSFDLDLIARYLREPPKRPEYRGAREHREFVANLALDQDTIRDRITRAWDASRVDAEKEVSGLRDEIDELVRTKYSRPEWSQRF